MSVHIGLQQRPKLRVTEQPGVKAWRASGEARGGEQQERGGGHHRQEDADDAEADAGTTRAQQQVAQPCRPCLVHSLLLSDGGA